MSSLNIDTSKLNRKAKESFANSLIDFGAGAARYATYVVLVIPATIFVKLILDEKDIFAFLWNNVHVLLVLSSISRLEWCLEPWFETRESCCSMNCPTVVMQRMAINRMRSGGKSL